jgi:hypothetical protein
MSESWLAATDRQPTSEQRNGSAVLPRLSGDLSRDKRRPGLNKSIIYFYDNNIVAAWFWNLHVILHDTGS